MPNTEIIAETTPAPSTTPTIVDENITQNAAALGKAVENVWEKYVSALSTADAYIELLTIGIALGLGLAASIFIRWIIRVRFKEIAESQSWDWVLKPTKLLTPLLVIVALSIARPIILHHNLAPVFISPAIQIATALLLIYAVHILVISPLMVWFLSITIATMVMLQSLGLLQPISQLLSNIGIKIGSMEITLLGFLHGIIICVLVFWTAYAGTTRLEKQLKSSKLSYNIRELLIKFSKITAYFVALLITLSVMGVDLTAFAVFGGALGVGIGLGLQKITANFVSGITLLMERSIRQGDLIQVADIHGYVRELNIRYTLVETFGGQEVSIPNETLTSNNIINWTMSNARARIEIPIGVAYGSDYKLAQQLILQAAQEHPRTLKDPQAVCVMREFAGFAVQFLLQFWIANVVEGTYSVQSEVMFRIAELFDAHRIQIPFPQQTVHIASMPDTLLHHAAEKES